MIEDLDFNRQISGKGYNWELSHKPRYTNPWTKEEAEQIKQEILSALETVKTLREPKCLECKGILTQWDDDGFVCDCCGFGKKSYDDFHDLQKYVMKQLLESIRDMKK